ncbi:MAG TPA: 30S ribosomal protein S18 [Nitrospiraceae bacterium]|nr:30S ribosomal protein S18 [Nitrospiraceae bacterium]
MFERRERAERGERGERGDREERGEREGRGFYRRKICRFCTEKVLLIDYKDMQMLRGFITDRGKIIPRRISGTCAKHQRELTTAIKRARNIAFLPFTERG